MPVEQPNTRKSLRQFQKHWESNQIMLSAGYELLNQSASQLHQALCCDKVYQKNSSIKVNECDKKDIYKWILQHPQVLKSPIANDGIKLSIDSQTVRQLVPQLLFTSII